MKRKKYSIKSCHLTRRFGVEHVLGVSSNSRLELPTYFRAISSYLLNFADFYQELPSILPISTNIRVFFLLEGSRKCCCFKFSGRYLLFFFIVTDFWLDFKVKCVIFKFRRGKGVEFLGKNGICKDILYIH